MFILSVTILFVGCEGNAVRFREPQPEDGKNAKSFSKKMMGEYLSTRDSSKLTITNTSIIREYDYPFEIPMKFIDTSKMYVLKMDTLFDKINNLRMYVKKENDTLKGEYHIKDELFSISQKNVLRKFNGKLFLNFNNGNEDEGNWVVWEMEYKKGKLWIGKISNKEDVDKLQKLTKTPVDTSADVVTTFQPTRKQLRKFMRQEGFGDKEEFVKTN